MMPFEVFFFQNLIILDIYWSLKMPVVIAKYNTDFTREICVLHIFFMHNYRSIVDPDMKICILNSGILHSLSRRSPGVLGAVGVPTHFYDVQELRQLDPLDAPRVLRVDPVHVGQLLLDPLQHVSLDQLDRFHLVLGEIRSWFMTNDVVIELNDSHDYFIVLCLNYQLERDGELTAEVWNVGDVKDVYMGWRDVGHLCYGLQVDEAQVLLELVTT